jgi:hypothetical protein
METVTSLAYLTYFASLENDMRFISLALFSSLIKAYGFMWVFWGVCLSLSATDLTLKTRKAIGRRDLESDVNRQDVAELLESSQQDHSLPTSTFDPTTFPLEKISIMAFQKLTRTYITTKSHFWENFLWTIAEIVFPFRLGYLLGASLFFLGIIGLSLDSSLSGLLSTWGFGQLPPTY